MSDFNSQYRPGREEEDLAVAGIKKHLEEAKRSRAMTESANACAPSRLIARDYITDKIGRLRRRADYLQAISDAMPKELTREQDAALYELISEVRV